ncbi:MAG: iron-containing alcohol dehydrogenase, partial [Alphaproteobacteria bacterium]|nr:iron-containing alcohol dehydrogenase [Alphaproteobacteria bacterium]
IRALEENGMLVHVFADILPDPTVANINQALDSISHFSPDLIVALGGGSPMDAAKMIWLMYENPCTKFEDIALRFMDIRKRIAAIPALGKKATFVAIPTTSGTGSEVTPFTVITDERTDIKYPITDYEFTPDMAIIDPDFVADMPPQLVAHSGMDALTHAIEAYTSVYANNFSDGQALEAIRLVFKYLPDSYAKGKKAKVAREKMHYAATIAGLAFANAFLGVCHSMAHTLGGAFHIPHGLANAVLLPYVIAYNATDNPTKQGLLPQYKYPFVKGRYAKIADHLHLDDGGDNRNKKVNLLIDKIIKLQRALDIPVALKDMGIDEKQFLKRLDELGQKAFDDQCTGGNPRYPLIEEIKEIYVQAYYGKPYKKKKV